MGLSRPANQPPEAVLLRAWLPLATAITYTLCWSSWQNLILHPCTGVWHDRHGRALLLRQGMDILDTWFSLCSASGFLTNATGL